MAKYISTTFGQISGRHGTAVGSVVNGKSVIRVFTKPGNPRTDKQVAHRARFSFTAKLLTPFRPAIYDGFGRGTNGYGKAFSIAFSEAVNVTYPEVSFDLSKVALSQGTLMNPLTATYSVSENQIEVAWDTAVFNNGSPRDLVYLVFYNQDTRAVIYLNAQGVRSDGSFSFGLPANWSENDLAVWLFLSNDKTSNFSNSIFLSGQSQEQLR